MIGKKCICTMVMFVRLIKSIICKHGLFSFLHMDIYAKARTAAQRCEKHRHPYKYLYSTRIDFNKSSMLI